MKKIFPILFLLSALFPIEDVQGQDLRKITVMVYMCGGNLESLNGSASADIQEMVDAGINMQEVTLLVMTGGTDYWHRGYESGQILIHEIGPRGSRIVRRAGRMNMGSSETLAELLTFGRENYPAEEYALILWDHGGGPLEGVCWDELFSLDNLSIFELVSGIRRADYDQKLSWIGFDACLMSSVEVASILSPYAEFMVASQETEPTSGWNYSFLKGIENDQNGAETGRRIVDAYFDGQENSRDILTLSCVDLSRIGELTDAVNRYFDRAADHIDELNFPEISEMRMASTGFGAGIKSSGNDGYDLVDAADLIRHFDENEQTQLLLKMLSGAIVYNRSNENGAEGLSLYHPAENKAKYLEAWRDNYERVSPANGYTRYVKAFGSILTGTELVDWRGLVTNYDGFDENGNSLLSLQLTPEQARNTASAQLAVMMNWESDNRNNYQKIFVDNAQIDENGLITGTYSGKTLFLEKENGELDGPLVFDRLRKGGRHFLTAQYSGDKWMGSDSLYVRYEFEAESTDPYPEIIRTLVLDDVTDTYTNRLSFSEEDYQWITFAWLPRYLPESDTNTVLPRYENWEMNDNLLGLVYTSLPNRWRLRFSDGLLTASDDLYAMFQITDYQYNVYSSPPVKISNPYAADITVKSAPAEPENLRIELTGQIITSELDKGLKFDVKATNTSDREISLSIEKPVILNGNFIVENPTIENISVRLNPGDSKTLTLKIGVNSLAGLQTADSLCLTISGSYVEQSEYTFMLENVDITSILEEKPLAETDENGLLVRLLSLEPDWYGRFYIENNSGSEIEFDRRGLRVNGIQRNFYCETEKFPSGTRGVYTFRIVDDVWEWNDSYEKGWVLSDHVIERHGRDSLENITCFVDFRNDGNKLYEPFTLIPEQPLTIPEHGSYIDTEGPVILPPEEDFYPNESAHLLLAENEVYRIELERFFIAENRIAAALDIINKTDEAQKITVRNCYANGGTVRLFKNPRYESDTFEYSLLPNALLTDSLVMRPADDYPDGSLISDLSCDFSSEGQSEIQTGTVVFKEPVRYLTSDTDETIWISDNL